jgi:endogenous inhibitor of DNA gyrase (YacG/DUF329 family)
VSQKSHPCPTCKTPVHRETTTAWPFCSDRCRLIDLGNWLGGKYTVSGDEKPSSDDENKH